MCGFNQRVGSKVIHFNQVVAAKQSLHQTTMLCDESGLILRDPFLLSVFSKGQHHKQLRPAIKLHVLAGVGHILNIIVRQLYAWRAEQTVPQRIAQLFSRG
ncbi:hypothetical protein HmCmsJML279_03927 [Escherichia coli]|nr:hypothetical protein HmCmsJML279_03927 [Escherichia coli]